MRISIWQQFSSNHSASYEVVGEFESTEAAQSARSDVIRIVTQAVEWCRIHREECYALNPKKPNPVEQHYGKHYGFNWKEQIDWLTYGVHEESIHQVERLLVISTRHVDTWQTGHQFANLLEAMGARVARDVMEGRESDIEGEVWMGMAIDITADISPDQGIILQTRLMDYVEQRKGRRKTYSIGWLIYHPRLQAYSIEEMRVLETNYLKDETESWPLHDKYQTDNKGFHEAWGRVRILPHDQWVLMSDCRRDMEIYRLSINLTPQKIEITDLQFSDIPCSFSALMMYLREYGCTNLEYSIRQLG